MNCPACPTKSCRSLEPCSVPPPGEEPLVAAYHTEATQALVQSAARLVDGGLAGTLSRLEELERFIVERGYVKVGLAYCYGMEKEAKQVLERFRGKGIRASGVSCTVGGMGQDQVNLNSTLPGVSCNPLTQAAQLQAEGVELAIAFGLCLGHDILFAKAFPGDQTTLVVKDRVHKHRPLDGLVTG